MNETWVVVFEDSPNRALQILKPGFRHCWATRAQGDGWLVVLPSFSHTQVAVVTHGCLEDMLGANEQLIHVEAQPSGYRMPGLFTCVEVVKSLLGISLPLLTPYQLWRYLGGEASQEIVEPDRA